MTKEVIKEHGSVENFHRLAKVHGTGVPHTSYDLLRREKPLIFFEAAIYHIRTKSRADKRDEWPDTKAEILARCVLPEYRGKVSKSDRANIKKDQASPQKVMQVMGLLGMKPHNYKAYEWFKFI